MKKISKFRRFMKGKGFLAALGICFAAVGLATYFSYSAAISKIGAPIEQGEETSATEVFGFPEEDAAAVDAAQAGIPLETETPEEANAFVLPEPAVVLPVDGEVIQPFSNGELVKSETLGVWKTHDGVDLVGELHSEVVTMTSGTVSEIYMDPLWGVCVTIDHGDGIIGCYMGLDEGVSVVIGDELKGGEVIGTIGQTAEVEISMPSHLHFALKKNGEWIDPIAYIEAENQS